MSGKWWPQEMMIPHKSEFLSTFLIVHAESFVYWYFNALDLYFLIPFVLSKEILWSRYCLLFLTKYKDPQSHYSFKYRSFNEAGAVMSTCRLLSFKKILSGPYLSWDERTTELPVSETFVCLIQQLLYFPTCLRQAAQLWLLR